ncbi:hypothetical protein RUM44_005894 [Polyplax serrata]|uniref:Uncharacterized protein n=1 Tax=Polyplax serrata TaxID=468196 RepID=A0ABR1AYE0_POLSC
MNRVDVAFSFDSWKEPKQRLLGAQFLAVPVIVSHLEKFTSGTAILVHMDGFPMVSTFNILNVVADEASVLLDLQKVEN